MDKKKGDKAKPEATPFVPPTWEFTPTDEDKADPQKYAFDQRATAAAQLTDADRESMGRAGYAEYQRVEDGVQKPTWEAAPPELRNAWTEKQVQEYLGGVEKDALKAAQGEKEPGQVRYEQGRAMFPEWPTWAEADEKTRAYYASMG